MKIKKSIQLTTEPLNSILENEESIDFRLDEAAWAQLKPGDTIEFWEDFSGWDKKPSDHARKVQVTIKEIFRASSFSQLIDKFPPSFAERGSKDEIISELRRWWTPEKEKEIGVLGFIVKQLGK